MKKIFTLFLSSILYISLAAQAPQGINYQAVAYNNLSQPVTNQTVGVRLSVLDGAANGPVLYSETQSPNTDNTGLFSIVIGNGTAVSGTFTGINWGNGTKWLKTEIDITGGNNYAVMGSSQFMSTPYAFYADKAGSTNTSFSIPDNLTNSQSVILTAGTNYTVPTGKTLYLPIAYWFAIDGDTLFEGSGSLTYFVTDYSKSMIGINSNSIVWIKEGSRVGSLVDKTVEWKTINIYNATLTVPAGKKFVIVTNAFVSATHVPSDYGNCKVTINGVGIELSNPLANIVLDEGSVLSTINRPAIPGNYIINGYFINK